MIVQLVDSSGNPSDRGSLLMAESDTSALNTELETSRSLPAAFFTDRRARHRNIGMTEPLLHLGDVRFMRESIGGSRRFYSSLGAKKCSFTRGRSSFPDSRILSECCLYH